MSAEAAPRAAVGASTAARAALWVAAWVPVVAYVAVALQRIGYPYELTYFEGSTVEVTARVVDGQPLYAAPTTEFTPWPYPPLYFWLTAAAAKVWGVELLSLRLVSFVASLAVFALLVAIVRRAGGGTLAGMVAAGLYAATYPVSGAWFDTARVDSLLLALLLAAVFVGMRARTWGAGAATGLLYFLAFLTKQSALVVAVPALIYLVWRRRAAGTAAGSVLAVAVVGSTVVGNVLTGGWYGRYVVTQLLGQAVDWRWLWDFPLRDLVVPFAVTVLTVAGLLVWRRRDPALSRWRRWRPTQEVAFLLAAGVGMVASAWISRLHEGGYDNVSMPAQAAVAVAAGLLLGGALRQEWWCGSKVVLGLAVALLAQVVLMASFRLDVLPSSADRAAGDRFVASLRELPRGVLVPTHPYYLRLAGLPTHASAIAIHDLWRSADGPATLDRTLPWKLAGVSAVVLDNEADESMFGDTLSREFRLVTTTFTPTDAFYPVTDLKAHPTRLYVRTSTLSS